MSNMLSRIVVERPIQ